MTIYLLVLGYRQLLALFLVLFSAIPFALHGQAAVVKRNVVLRNGPAKTTANLRTLQKNDELTLLEPDESNGYYNVRVANGDEGWVFGAYIRVLSSPPVTTTPAGPLELYRSCTLEGNAVAGYRRQANVLKNRITAPTPTDIDQTVTLTHIAVPSDDRTRWTPQQASSVVGYVFDVKPGGSETVNCGEEDSKYKDTHIEIVVDPANTGKKKRIIVEVTPRWRKFRGDQGEDWSTTTLKTKLKNHWVRFTGWMLFSCAGTRRQSFRQV
jgi:uncharacterized protein YgiM (DUF1202 family)